jgi:chloramphenicol-sensitive protein RarD
VAAVLALLLLGRLHRLAEVFRQPRRLLLAVVAAAVISVNWGLYVWGVNSGHVVDTSLGYFVNPLFTVALALLVLRERLRPVQKAAVVLGVGAVSVLRVASGRLPWLALVLATTFAGYGFLKKRLALDGLESLAAETVVQFLPALAFLLVLDTRGESTFMSHGAEHAALLMLSGLVTALPTAAFSASAVRVPLSTRGLMQYTALVCQFLIGVFYLREEMPPERWAGFGLVWLALALLTVDALRSRADDSAASERPVTAGSAR